MGIFSIKNGLPFDLGEHTLWVFTGACLPNLQTIYLNKVSPFFLLQCLLDLFTFWWQQWDLKRHPYSPSNAISESIPQYQKSPLHTVISLAVLGKWPLSSRLPTFLVEISETLFTSGQGLFITFDLHLVYKALWISFIRLRFDPYSFSDPVHKVL